MSEAPSDNNARWREWWESFPLRFDGNSAMMISHARAVGLHLMTFAWTHALTLTSKEPMSAAAMFRALGRYQRHVTRVAQRPVPYFWALEPDRATGAAFHAHGLIAGTHEVPATLLRRSWKLGNTDVAVYDQTQFGAIYASKRLGLSEDTYDLSFALPPRVDGWVPGEDDAMLDQLLRSSFDQRRSLRK